MNTADRESEASGGSAPATVIAVVAAGITLPFGESVIGVQLDAIARSFSIQGAMLQWVVNAYMLTFATSILAVGVLADRLGRRRLFAMGLLLSLVANAAAVVTPSADLLIALRALAGLAAGTLLATGPALLAARFPQDDRSRARAFAAFGSAAGSGIAFGPLIGGLIMAHFGWRAVFAVYLPFLLLAGALLPRIAASRAPDAPPIDALGIGVFTLALGLVVWALEGTSRFGFMAAACSLLLFIALIFIERGRQHPAIAPAVFANPLFRAMSATMVAWQIAVAVSMVYVPAVVVAGLSASPAIAGLSILPMAIALFAATPLGPMMVSRFGVAGFVGGCIACMAMGDAVIALTLTAAAPLSQIGLVCGLGLIGIGGGAANGSMDNLAMRTMPATRAGMAAGVFQTVRIGAAALAVAAAGSLLDIASGSATHAAAGALTTRYAELAGGASFMLALLALIAVAFVPTSETKPVGNRR
ncbi:MFS transporter [Salinisphaera sp. Q1T1-3]|uniref:MFS transporter n=1 Tax=Salinisphaera sp. Q1T1-3 TaxID=2321229 RepID=UPI000E7733A2|nr:MFS transporter [Salinisphaera sp. Q1T1-3]RJS95124.1 MFS transporter [Salinisphaera sp. Q1T1-3]